MCLFFLLLIHFPTSPPSCCGCICRFLLPVFFLVSSFWESPVFSLSLSLCVCLSVSVSVSLSLSLFLSLSRPLSPSLSLSQSLFCLFLSLPPCLSLLMLVLPCLSLSPCPPVFLCVSRHVHGLCEACCCLVITTTCCSYPCC